MRERKTMALMLLEDIPSSLLQFERTYIKAGTIYYKIKDLPIAVSKKLNNVDLSILSEEQTEFIKNSYKTSLEKYSRLTDEEFSKLTGRYYSIIDKWLMEESIFSGLNEMKKYEGTILNLNRHNYGRIFTREESYDLNKKIIRVLLEKKFDMKLVYERDNDDTANIDIFEEGFQRNIDITLDIEYDLLFAPEGVDVPSRNMDANTSIDNFYVKPNSDNNLSTFKTLYERSVSLMHSNYSLHNVDNMLFRALLLSYIIYSYRVESDNEAEESLIHDFYKMLFSLSSDNYRYGGYLQDIDGNSDIINSGLLEWALDTRYSSGYNYSITNLIKRLSYKENEYRYNSSYLPGGRYRLSTPSNITQDIDFERMSDETLLLFRKLVNDIIERHAKYIKKDLAELETYFLFLYGTRTLNISGEEYLKGKKHTRTVLTEHLKLNELEEEIKRRGL